MRLASQVLRAVCGDVVRVSAVVCATAALTLALGMIFPVQYELDTAGYRHTQARTIAPLEATLDDIPSVRAALGNEATAIYIDIFSAVEANGASVGNVSLWALLGDNLDTEVTLMPDATRVAGPPRDPADHSAWIDINSDIASTLGVGPGDRVAAYVWGDEPAPFTVRGVYAARDTGSGGVALISARALSDFASAAPGSSHAMMTAASKEQVEHMLNSPPWDKRMGDLYTAPITAERISDKLQDAERHAFVNFTLVLVASAIAFMSLLGLVISEAFSLVSGFRARADALIELGVRPTEVHGTLALGSSAFLLAALAAGAGIGTLAYTSGFAGPALPPTLERAWWLATGIAGAVAVTVIVLTSRRQRAVWDRGSYIPLSTKRSKVFR